MIIGFVYLWRNTNTKKSYIGSHIGHINDGYIGSGTHFKNAYRKDPLSFRRRILEYVDGDVSDVIERETYWLNLASKNPNKYYNKIFVSVGLHPYSYDALQAMKFSKIGRKWFTDGISDWMLYEHEGVERGLVMGRTKRSSIYHSNKDTRWITNKGLEMKISKHQDVPDGWSLGRSEQSHIVAKSKILSNETKDKIRAANKGLIKSNQARQKMSESKKGRKWYRCGDLTKLSHNHPGQGWKEGR